MDKVVRLWDLRSRQLVRTLTDASYAVLVVAFHPHVRNLLVLGGANELLTLLCV